MYIIGGTESVRGGLERGGKCPGRSSALERKVFGVFVGFSVRWMLWGFCIANDGAGRLQGTIQALFNIELVMLSVLSTLGNRLSWCHSTDPNTVRNGVGVPRVSRHQYSVYPNIQKGVHENWFFINGLCIVDGI